MIFPAGAKKNSLGKYAADYLITGDNISATLYYLTYFFGRSRKIIGRGLNTPPAQGGEEGNARLLLTINPACSFSYPSCHYIIIKHVLIWGGRYSGQQDHDKKKSKIKCNFFNSLVSISVYAARLTSSYQIIYHNTIMILSIHNLFKLNIKPIQWKHYKQYSRSQNIQLFHIWKTDLTKVKANTCVSVSCESRDTRSCWVTLGHAGPLWPTLGHTGPHLSRTQ